MRNSVVQTCLMLCSVGLLLGASESGASPRRCERVAGSSLLSCVKRVAGQHRRCVANSTRKCAASNDKILRQIDKIERRIEAACSSDAEVQAAGFTALTRDALIERLQSACRAETDALFARAYAGPHSPAARQVFSSERNCLKATFRSGVKLLSGETRLQLRCIDRESRGRTCNQTKTAERIAKLRARASSKAAAACDTTSLEDLIALDRATFFDRASSQAHCMTAITRSDTSPLALDCGPRAQIEQAPRGEYVRIVLDEAEWGTRCGTGSPYAFWIRLAPEGHPVENVVLQMQGGGVCINEGQCSGVSAGLFSATDNNPAQGGIMSNSPTVSPFANWTKIYLPYCTQDLFIGGGATNVWPSITVHRWGAINTRVTLRYLRDILWREMDGDGEGYRPDRIRMLFGGTSAGGFGSLYNYHYILDDLQWANTAAWPDSALALNNGEVVGIGGLGILLLADSGSGWASLPYMPPYCTAIGCGLGPTIYTRSAERLEAVPMQRFLVISNQVDGTQVSTTSFPSTAAWVNELRQSYCDTAGTTGLSYFLPAQSGSQHVIATKTNWFTGVPADGILMRDWVEWAITDADSLPDAVEEGSLTTTISGVDPFPCTVD